VPRPRGAGAGQAQYQCDLGSAAEITLRTAVAIGWGWSFRILYARQAPGTPPVRFVLEGPDWFLVSAQHLRLLAQIISSRAGGPSQKIRQVAQRLRDMASLQDDQNRPVDWSFRTVPKGGKSPAASSRPVPAVHKPRSMGRMPRSAAFTRDAWSASVWSAYSRANRASARSRWPEEPA
jgi:hypothetical protein